MQVEVTLVEHRCDRCQALMETQRGDEHKVNLETYGAFEATLSFLSVEDTRSPVVIKYDRMCPSCTKRVHNTIAKLFAIDRTRGGKKSGATKAKVKRGRK